MNSVVFPNLCLTQFAEMRFCRPGWKTFSG